MNLYLHDCSYLFTECGKRKSQECYDIEAQQKEKALDDGEQDGNEYKNAEGCIKIMGDVKWLKKTK